MKTPTGIKVVEFNCRFGDPETEVVLPRLKTDIYEVFSAIAQGGTSVETLEGTADKEGEIVPASELMPELEWSDEATLGFVMASKGYPGSYEKGFEITGLDDALSDPAIRIYHMGTKSADSAVDASSGDSTASLRSAPPLASQSEAPVPPLNVPRVAVVEPARLASTNC